MNLITYEELLKLKDYILIDVRTPKEFEEEAIPNAINIPVLLDDERIDVGTTYKQVSPEKAKEIAVESISNRLPDMFREVQKYSKRKIVFYCARGGMRSGAMSSLFLALGYSTYKLDGGYKEYRKYIINKIPELNQDIKYVILHGKTGIGKTKILQKLEEKKYSVLDLEKLANHKGSFFGGLCEKEKQSQKKFDSLIFDFLYKNKPSYVIVESESKRIGNVYVPDSICHSIFNGRHILLETPIEHRVKIIKEDYAKASEEELQACLDKVGRYITVEKHEEYSNLLKKGQLDLLSEILMLEYYDALYQKSISSYTYEKEIFYNSIDEGVKEMVNYLDENEFLQQEESHK